MPDTLDLPIYVLTPDSIFSNNIPFLDVNFINPKKEYIVDYDANGDPIKSSTETYKDENGNEQTRDIQSSAYKLRDTISGWYVALRNLAIVGLLSILLYIGIRIIMSSSAQDKAKYKQRIFDWVIAMCLLVSMHYIMSFAQSITEMLTETLNKNNKRFCLNLDLKDYDADDDVKAILNKNADGNDYKSGTVHWQTDFMGQARFMLQMESESGDENETIMVQMGYTVIYVVFVMYTVMFLFQYLKRLLYIAFLTIIAPIVALTYPIDKIHDGQAQAFNMWLKEYIFNLLLQPFHLLLYTVLVGSAMELAGNNMLYSLAAIGFLLPGEKVLRRFFGFDKASTAAAANGALGGALAMQGINMLRKRGGGKNGGNKDKGNEGGANKPIRTRTVDDSNLISDAFGGGNSDGGETNTPPAMPTGRGNTLPPDVDNSGGAQRDWAQQQMSNDGSVNSNVNGNDRLGQGTLAGEDLSSGVVTDSGIWLPGSARDAVQPPQTPPRTVELPDPPPSPQTPPRTVNPPSPSSRPAGLPNNPTPPPAPRRMDTKPKRIARAVGRTAKHYAAQEAKGLAGMAARGVKKVATGAIPAAAMGMVGVAAGLASDDYGNVVKYGATGAGAGMVLGAGISQAGSATTADVKHTLVEEYYGENYEKIMNKKADKKFRKDPEAISAYKQQFGEDYSKAMEAAIQYRDHGITDNELIIKAMSSQGFGAEGDYASQQRIALAKMAGQAKSEKDIGELEKKFAAKGVSEEDGKRISKRLREMHNLVQ